MLVNPLEHLRAGRANGWGIGGFNAYNLESARVVGAQLAAEIVSAFLPARFTGEERHARRLGKVLEMEKEGK